MADTIKVKAADPDKPVIMPGVRRRVDADGRDLDCIRDEWIDVPNTRFYRLRIAQGDLVRWTEPTTTEAAAPEVRARRGKE
jgi:hypothetical protein